MTAQASLRDLVLHHLVVPRILLFSDPVCPRLSPFTFRGSWISLNRGRQDSPTFSVALRPGFSGALVRCVRFRDRNLPPEFARGEL